MSKSVRCAVLPACLLLAAAPAAAQYYADAEAGAVTADHNTVKIPLKGGTRFSLTDDLKAEGGPYARFRFGRRFGRNDLSFLAAPLTLRSAGTLDRAVVFKGETFPAGSRAEAVYRFNSYRVRYLYEFRRTDRLTLRWGGALKVRHAGITLTGGGASAESKDTGLVPLAAFSGEYSFSPGWRLLLDAEALGAPQGRAEDVMVAVSREAGAGLRLRAGYRFLEGGSGAGSVYTFAWLHYLLVGAAWEF